MAMACGGAEAPDTGPTATGGSGPSETRPDGTATTETLGDGSITAYAGSGSPRFSGDGGPALEAGIFAPAGLALDRDGNLFLSTDKRIRRVEAATGIITTVAGSGSSLMIADDGPAIEAGFRNPRGLAVDGDGNLFIADHGNGRIRRVDAATGIVTTVAGGAVPSAALVKEIGDGGPADQSYVYEPMDVAVDSQGNLYVVSNHRIRKVDAASGIISTVAGTGHRNLTGDGGPAVEATIAEPEGVAVDASGNIYIADSDNHRVRKVEAATGLMSTLAGVGMFQDRSGGNPIADFRREGTGAGYSGDGGPASSAMLRLPSSLSVDPQGNLFIVDAAVRVRRIDAATGVISTHFGAESITTQEEGGKLTVHVGAVGKIVGVAVNDRGDVFLADALKNFVHLVPTATP